MSINPIITFKAGACDVDTNVNPPTVKAKPTPGYLYLFEEDDLVHFCWRPRSASMSSPELELVMVPTDGRFVPYKDPGRSSDSSTTSPTNGRIFVLKFQSSTQRHFFWLQSKTQHAQGDPSWFSPRDLKLGDIVDRLLQGDQVNAREEFADAQNEGGDDGGDAEMRDVEPEEPSEGQGNITGAGASTQNQGGATGSQGGSTGGERSAAMPTDDATAAVQNFLRSMQGNQALQASQSHPQGQLYTALPDLLPPSTTIPFIDSAPVSVLDNLLGHIPPILLVLSQQADADDTSAEPNPETVRAAVEAMSVDQKKEILRRVLRSPQFLQSLTSLTVALRDGGLPTISEALKIPVENGGFFRGGRAPLGGGDAVEAFVKGAKASVEKEKKESGAEKMDTE